MTAADLLPAVLVVAFPLVVAPVTWLATKAGGVLLSLRDERVLEPSANVVLSAVGAVLLLDALEVPLVLDLRPGYAALVPLGVGLYVVDDAVLRRLTAGPVKRGHRRPAVVLPALFAPVPEELLYRACLSVLLEPFGVAAFVAVSASAFGAAHLVRGSRQEAGFKTANGAVYALLFVAAGTVVVPFLVHFGYNAAYAYYVAERPSLR